MRWWYWVLASIFIETTYSIPCIPFPSEEEKPPDEEFPDEPLKPTPKPTPTPKPFLCPPPPPPPDPPPPLLPVPLSPPSAPSPPSTPPPKSPPTSPPTLPPPLPPRLPVDVLMTRPVLIALSVIAWILVVVFWGFLGMIFSRRFDGPSPSIFEYEIRL